MQPPDMRGRWVSFAEAMRILRLPETTLRSQIREGKIIGEPRPRNPDNPKDRRVIYQVLITDPPDDPPPSADSEADAPAIALSAAITAAVEPLAERLAAQDAVIAQKDARIAALEREAGAATTRASMLEAELDLERRGWLRKIKDALW